MTVQAPITVDDVKSFSGEAANNKDGLIASLIDAVLPAFEGFCNRPLDEQTATEYRDGNDASRMLLVHYPISDVSSVIIDGIAIPKSTGANVAGYFSPVGGRAVMLRGYKFTRGYRNVQITVTAGYGNFFPWPADIKLACNLWVTTRMRERSRLGVGSQSLAGQTITYDAASGTSNSSEGMPSAARSILNNYTNTLPESGT